VKDASSDPTKARSIWTQYPDCNVAIATGSPAGIIVLDEDGIEGAATVATLERKHGALPPTLTARTGRQDGRHRLFGYFGSDVGNNNSGKLGTKLDFKGERGYIVCAPSIHVSGRRYQWELPLKKIAPLPEWLRAMMIAKPPAAPAPRITPAAVLDTCDRAHASLLRRAQTYAAVAEGAGEGSRNDAVFNLAGNLAAIVGEHGEALSEGEVLAIVTDFNSRCTPPLAEKEVHRTVHSAFHNGTPREPKPPRSPVHRQLSLRGREVAVHGS
jgi:putative DNA primase/helicase